MKTVMQLRHLLERVTKLTWETLKLSRLFHHNLNLVGKCTIIPLHFSTFAGVTGCNVMDEEFFKKGVKVFWNSTGRYGGKLPYSNSRS